MTSPGTAEDAPPARRNGPAPAGGEARAPANRPPAAGAGRRIAIVLHHDACRDYADGGSIGGVARDILEETQPEWDVWLFGPAEAAPPLAGAGYHPIRPGWLDRAWGAKRGYRSALLRALRSFAPALAEVHISPVLAARLRRAVPGLRVVWVVHNTLDHMAAERLRWLSGVDAAVCVSDAVRASLLAGLPEGLARRAVTIHNAIRGLPPAAPVGAREPVILFAGRIVPEKGVDAFLAAAERLSGALPGWSFEIHGAPRQDTPPEFVRQCRAMADAAGVAWRGHTAPALLRERLAQVAIVVVPSRSGEGLPRIAQEAIGCGAAVVASHCPGLPEALGDAALTADPDEADALAQAIARLARDPELRADLAERGQRQARAFAPASIAARWTALRRSLLDASHPEPTRP
ncbi:MAG: glycosyltransferase family 4 protein [Acetobacteraceae bacterium]